MKPAFNNQTALQQLADYLAGRRTLLLALSGGLDSSVLLHQLVQLRQQVLPDLQIRAVHIHHGLNVLADSWVEHCQAVCQQWQVPLHVARVKVDAQQGGIEAAARQARYQVFAQQLQEGECLLTAQHLDDQSETFLLALKRGSGPAGLSAMATRSDFAAGELLRPLLNSSRQQLEAYARQQQLSWIEDDSNQDTRFDRNFLRLDVLPALNQRWPHFAQAVARSASLCAEQESLLDELLQDSLHSLVDQQGSLSIAGLLPLSPAKRAALLRRWFAQQGAIMPAREQLQRLWQEVALSQPDAEPQWQLEQWTVRRFRQRLYLLPVLATITKQPLAWSRATTLKLPANLGQLVMGRGVVLRAPNSDELVTVRFAAQGIVRIVGRSHARALKKLWQELGVPPWQRERIPLLYYGEQLIAAPGLFITEQGQCIEGQAQWQVEWQIAEHPRGQEHVYWLTSGS